MLLGFFALAAAFLALAVNDQSWWLTWWLPFAIVGFAGLGLILRVLGLGQRIEHDSDDHAGQETAMAANNRFVTGVRRNSTLPRVVVTILFVLAALVVTYATSFPDKFIELVEALAK